MILARPAIGVPASAGVRSLGASNLPQRCTANDAAAAIAIQRKK